METVLWSMLALVLLFGYMAAVISCIVDGPSPSEWWEPFVVGAVLPFWLLYENRVAIGKSGLMLLVLVAGCVGLWVMGEVLKNAMDFLNPFRGGTL